MCPACLVSEILSHESHSQTVAAWEESVTLSVTVLLWPALLHWLLTTGNAASQEAGIFRKHREFERIVRTNRQIV